MILKVEEKNRVVQATILPDEASLSNADAFKEEMITIIGKAKPDVLLPAEAVSSARN